jgi:hypothetical protein
MDDSGKNVLQQVFPSYERGKFPSAKKLVLEMNEATGSEGKVSVFRIFKPMNLNS